MLESMCSEIKTYHYEIVDSLESDEDTTREQEVFNEHQRKTMGFIDRLGDLLAKPQPVASIPVSMSTRLIDRQLDVIVVPRYPS